MIFSLLALFTLLRYWNYRWLIHSFCCYWSANLILNELSTGSSYRNTGSRYRIWHETGVLEFMLLFNIFIEPRSSSYIGILFINSVLILRTNRGKIPQDQHSWFWDRVSIIPYSSVNGMNLDIIGWQVLKVTVAIVVLGVFTLHSLLGSLSRLVTIILSSSYRKNTDSR